MITAAHINRYVQLPKGKKQPTKLKKKNQTKKLKKKKTHKTNNTPQKSLNNNKAMLLSQIPE